MNYSKKEKLIFRYFDGKKGRWADPVVIRRRMGMALAPVTLEETLRRCKDTSTAEGMNSKELLVKAIRKAFEMPCNQDAPEDKPEEYGATDNECVDAFNAYLTFNKKKEESTDSTQPPPSSASLLADVPG